MILKALFNHVSFSAHRAPIQDPKSSVGVSALEQCGLGNMC